MKRRYFLVVLLYIEGSNIDAAVQFCVAFPTFRIARECIFDSDNVYGTRNVLLIQDDVVTIVEPIVCQNGRTRLIASYCHL